MRARSNGREAGTILVPKMRTILVPKMGTILVPKIFEILIFWIRQASPGTVQWVVKAWSDLAPTWVSIRRPIEGPNGDLYGSPDGRPDGRPDGDQ